MNTPKPEVLHLGIHAQDRPQHPAIVMGATGAVTTYAMLNDLSYKLAQHLRSNGLERGDHVAILMRNGPAYLVVCWAAQRAGLTFTPVSWHLSPDEVAYIVDDCGAKALIISSAEAALGQAVAAKIDRLRVRLVDGPACGAFASLEGVFSADVAGAPLDECEGQVMSYSSGTTGRPKGIKRPALCQPWGTPTVADGMLRMFHGVGSDAVLLSVSPLYHAAPLGWSMGTLRQGGTVVLTESFDALQTLQLIDRYKATHAHVVPTMFVRMLNLPREQRQGHDLSSLRRAVHAAAPCPVDIKRRMIDWFGPIVYEYYAGSENNGMCAVDSQDWLAHPGTVGRAVFGKVHILGEDGEELPTGEIGTIYFSGTPSFEYHNDPGKSRSAFSKQGYSTLGDFGYIDQDGFVYIADRRTDLILSGGVNIYPRETEEALLMHPNVLDVAVVGVPSAEFGQDVLAVVELKEGVECGPSLAAELIEFSRNKIAHFKCPRRVEFAALPRTATGKLLRRKLKEQYSAITSAA